jgi:hypothetical protein
MLLGLNTNGHNVFPFEDLPFEFRLDSDTSAHLQTIKAAVISERGTGFVASNPYV